MAALDTPTRVRYDWSIMNLPHLYQNLKMAVAVVLVCCGPKASPEATGTTSASDAATGGTSDATPEPTGQGIETNSDTSLGTVSSTTAQDNESATSLALPDDMGRDDIPCNPFLDQCPPATKCTLYDTDDSGDWDDYRCRPLSPDPKQLYEVCMITGNGIDTCDKHLVCWSDDGSDTGLCYGLCVGSVDDPSCTDPEAYCAIFADSLSVCVPTCNPLINECAQGELCGPNGDYFLCIEDQSNGDGGLYVPCESPYECNPGLGCTDSASVAKCDPKFLGCCVPWCDLEQTDFCPDDLACEPWWEPGTEHPGTENLGICSSQ